MLDGDQAIETAAEDITDPNSSVLNQVGGFLEMCSILEHQEHLIGTLSTQWGTVCICHKSLLTYN